MLVHLVLTVAAGGADGKMVKMRQNVYFLAISPSFCLAPLLQRRRITAGQRKDIQRFQHHPHPSGEEGQRGGAELRGRPPGTGWPEANPTLSPGRQL